MIIDSHAHFAPQPLFDALAVGQAKFGGVECLHQDGTFRLAFAGRAPTRPVMPKLREFEQRLEWMDNQHLDYQVVAPWTDSFGYEIETANGIAWTRFLNETLWRGCENQDRLIPLASLPMQNGPAAANMLEEILELGFKGVMIGTQPGVTAACSTTPPLNSSGLVPTNIMPYFISIRCMSQAINVSSTTT